MRNLAVILILFLVGCAASTPKGDCTPMNCGGCCDGQGQCQSGVKKEACGSGGFTCLACAANQLCGAKSTCEVDPNAPKGGGSAGATGGGSAGTVEQEYVTAHNTARQRASPAPSPALPDVSWDATVADFAKQGSERCIFTHRQQNQYGENLFASTNDPTPTAVVQSWESEKAAYTYSTNSCASTCGHYTQVVWRSSVKIGCSKTLCSTNSPFGGGDWYLVACNYSPPGNFQGQKPY